MNSSSKKERKAEQKQRRSRQNVIPLAPALWLSKVVLFDVESFGPPSPFSTSSLQLPLRPVPCSPFLSCGVARLLRVKAKVKANPAQAGRQSAHITAPLCTCRHTYRHTHRFTLTHTHTDAYALYNIHIERGAQKVREFLGKNKQVRGSCSREAKTTVYPRNAKKEEQQRKEKKEKR